MLAMYGTAWSSQFGVQPEGVAADTWAAALTGLDGTQIAVGLRACIAEGREFPPNAPRFRGMCLGIPAFETVRLEVLRPVEERSPFTRLAWSFVDGYRHRHASVQDGATMLRAAYDRAADHVMRGHPLPSDGPALEPPQRSLPIGIPETRQGRSAHLQQLLGALYNPKTADPDWDPSRERRRLQREQVMAQLGEVGL